MVCWGAVTRINERPQLVFATQNQGTLRELQSALAGLDIEILTPAFLGLLELDPEETGTSYRENALIKAKAFAEASGAAPGSSLPQPEATSARVNAATTPAVRMRMECLLSVNGRAPSPVGVTGA